MARIQDLVVKIECDSYLMQLLEEIRNTHSFDAYVCNLNGVGKVNYRPNFEIEKGCKIVKKLYKVFVIENDGTVHEVNKVAETHQGAMFDAVKELGLDAKYDDLDVYALEIFTLKSRKCC